MSEHTSAWGRLVGIGAAVTVAVASIAGACSSTPAPTQQVALPIPALCSATAPTVPAGAVPTLRFDAWARLLLRDYAPGFAAANARDCTNTPVEWREFNGNCAEYCDEPVNAMRPESERCRVPMTEVVPQRAITDDDVIVSRLSGSLRLVWVITDRFSNGEAVGPVALTEFTDDHRVVVRAIGTVRNYPKRARMRLDSVGARRVLVHEGEICSNDEDRSTCRRAARLMLLRSTGEGGARFLAEPLRSNRGRCYGPARFEFAKDTNVTLPTGWRRTFQLATAIEVRGNGVQVHETVTVQDRDPARAEDPPRPYRRAGQDRAVYVFGDTFVASDPSLWSRVLSQEARVNRIPDAGVPRDASGDADVVDGGDDFRGDPMDGGI